MKLSFFIRQVKGQSMQPTLNAGNLLIASKKFELHKGSLVIAKVNGREIVKRVIDIKGSKVFIVGDNAEHSTDSRTLGWFSVDQIIGKIIWPKTHQNI